MKIVEIWQLMRQITELKELNLRTKYDFDNWEVVWDRQHKEDRQIRISLVKRTFFQRREILCQVVTLKLKKLC